MNHFCTITTTSHLYKTYALAESLKNQQADAVLHVLVVDDSAEKKNDNCRFWSLTDLSGTKSAVAIVGKYKSSSDKLRWSLKPVFLQYLLAQKIADTVIYLDNDLFFYSDYQFLFTLLKEHSFLLTPHHYPRSPAADQNWLEANFRVGLYNAGFIGANKNALSTLKWWADCCLYRCEKNTFRGLFDDQKYLDLIPVMEQNAHIVRHAGCNVAGWNTEICKREMIDNMVMISGKFPVVFIHFNNTTIREIVNGSDKILDSYYQEYVTVLKKYKPDLLEADLVFALPFKHKLKYQIWKFLTVYGF